MKIYLASRYSRKEELKKVAEELEGLGNEIISSWLDCNRRYEDEEDKETYVPRMVNEVKACDCLIMFNDPEGQKGRNGGKHVEFGIAMGLDKRLIVTGHRENLFYYHPKIQFYVDTETMMNDLWRQPK